MTTEEKLAATLALVRDLADVASEIARRDEDYDLVADANLIRRAALALLAEPPPGAVAPPANPEEEEF